MASCLVPEFPAVLVTLEHLGELKKQVREYRVPEMAESVCHLTEVGAALSELEFERHDTHEELEVETIENAKLRHQILTLRARVYREMARVTQAIRAAATQKTESLQQELFKTTELYRETEEKLEALRGMNQGMEPERQQLKHELEEMTMTLSEQTAQRETRELKLHKLRDMITTLKFSIAAVERDTWNMKHKLRMEKDSVPEMREVWDEQMSGIEDTIEQKVESVRKRMIELDELDRKKEEAEDYLNDLMEEMAKREQALLKLKEEKEKHQQELDEETIKYKDLLAENKVHRKVIKEYKQTLHYKVHKFQDKVATIEAKIAVSRAAGLLFRDSIAQLEAIYNRWYFEESQVTGELMRVSQRLNRIKLQLNQITAAILQRRREIKLMGKQTQVLRETDKVKWRHYLLHKEELRNNLTTERERLVFSAEEILQLKVRLEEELVHQGQRLERLKSNVQSAAMKYKELEQEKETIHKQLPDTTDLLGLKKAMAQKLVELKEREEMLKQQIQEKREELQAMNAKLQEKQSKLDAKEEQLKQVEQRRSEAVSRNERLKKEQAELTARGIELQLMEKKLAADILKRLAPKEDMKEELTGLRVQYSLLLERQSVELKDVETKLYNSSGKLEHVSMENRRFHIQITQMNEDLTTTRSQEEHHRREANRLRASHQALFLSLQGDFRMDKHMVEDFLETDGAVLACMTKMLEQLEVRRQQLATVGNLLQKQIVDLGKRLGDTMTKNLRIR